MEVLVDIAGYAMIGLILLILLIWMLNTLMNSPVFVVKSHLSGVTDSFNQAEWLAHPENNCPHTVRATMADDLVYSVLRPGLSRDAVHALIGPPTDVEISKEERLQVQGADDDIYDAYLVATDGAARNWLVVEYDQSNLVNRAWLACATAP